MALTERSGRGHGNLTGRFLREAIVARAARITDIEILKGVWMPSSCAVLNWSRPLRKTPAYEMKND